MRRLVVNARSLRAAAVALIAAGMIVTIGSQTAGASVTVDLTCNAYLWSNGSFDPNSPVKTGLSQQLDIGNLTGPTEVNAGSTFTVHSPSTSRVLPTTQDAAPFGTATINEVKNVVTDIEVDGAAAIGTTTLSGGNVIGAGVTKTGNVAHLSLPGSQNGSVITTGPTGNAFFPGGSTLTSPNLSTSVTAGAAGTTISAKIVKQELDSIVTIPNLGQVGLHLICTPAENTLGSVQVVAPPPPGAPNAVADVASTAKGTAVTVDVLKNDVPNSQLPIDTSSLAITSDPKHGTAEINADHTVTYTPAASFSGTDEFKYKICSLIEAVGSPRTQAAVEPCDTATVTVTVAPPPTTTTTAAPTTTVPSTVAPQGSTVASAPTLPRTGSSSAPLAGVGGALLVCGLAALGFEHSRRRGA